MPLVADCDSRWSPRPESQTLYRRNSPSSVDRTTMSTAGGAVSCHTTACDDVWPAISMLPSTANQTPWRQRGSADSNTNRKADPSRHSIASMSQTGRFGVDNVEFKPLFGSFMTAAYGQVVGGQLSTVMPPTAPPRGRRRGGQSSSDALSPPKRHSGRPERRARCVSEVVVEQLERPRSAARPPAPTCVVFRRNQLVSYPRRHRCDWRRRWLRDAEPPRGRYGT